MTIAEVAGGLVAAVGGGETAHLLLPLLEALAEKEETVVRAKVSLPAPAVKIAVVNTAPCGFLHAVS